MSGETISAEQATSLVKSGHVAGLSAPITREWPPTQPEPIFSPFRKRDSG
jgi:hypothetical protein